MIKTLIFAFCFNAVFCVDIIENLEMFSKLMNWDNVYADLFGASHSDVFAVDQRNKYVTEYYEELKPSLSADIVTKLIKASHLNVHEMETVGSEMRYAWYYWGYNLEIKTELSANTCKNMISQLSLSLQTQVYSVSKHLANEDISASHFVALASYANQVSARLPSTKICDEGGQPKSIAAFWAEPYRFYEVHPNLEILEKSPMVQSGFVQIGADLKTIEELIIGTKISTLAYTSSGDSIKNSLNDLRKLHPKVLGNLPITKITKTPDDKKGKSMYLANSDDTLVVGFRGTRPTISDGNMREIAMNACCFHADKYCQDGDMAKSHLGFSMGFRCTLMAWFPMKLEEHLIAMRDSGKPLRRIIFAGHSLGGALNILATDWFFVEFMRTINNNYLNMKDYMNGVKEKFVGISLASPPVGDRVFAEKFEALSIRFLNYYASSDFVPNLMVSAQEGHCSQAALKTETSFRKCLGSIVGKVQRSQSTGWYHVGKMIRLEDFGFPNRRHVHYGESWLRELAKFRKSHGPGTYVDGLRKLFLLSSDEDDAKGFLLASDKFRLYSYKTEKYCVPREESLFHTWAIFCDASKEEADQHLYSAKNLLEHGQVAKDDLFLISYADDIVLMNGGELVDGYMSRMASTTSLSGLNKVGSASTWRIYPWSDSNALNPQENLSKGWKHSLKIMMDRAQNVENHQSVATYSVDVYLKEYQLDKIAFVSAKQRCIQFDSTSGGCLKWKRDANEAKFRIEKDVELSADVSVEPDQAEEEMGIIIN